MRSGPKLTNLTVAEVLGVDTLAVAAVLATRGTGADLKDKLMK